MSKQRIPSLLRKITILLVSLVFAGTSSGKVIYVDDDAPGANNGTSWIDAYKFLQDALAEAAGGDEIRVAEGIYRPDETSADPNGSGDREATFQLINGVSLKGGYAGFGEPDPNTRDIVLYETTLSGDLDGNDVEIKISFDFWKEPTRVDNSINLVTASGTDITAVLDGFTIMGGSAIGTIGGGMYNSGGSPKVKNCIFKGNIAQYNGGGMCIIGGEPELINCVFVRNYAFEGGGIRNTAWSNPILTDCVFIKNWAGYGGGVYNSSFSKPILTGCVFIGNRASEGGGVCNLFSSPTLINCLFSGNRALIGGGILIDNELDNVTILTNCTFGGNLARFSGGGIYNGSDDESHLTNCIFWGNIPDQIYGGTSIVIYSDMQGGWPGSGWGNIDADPCFAVPGYWDPNETPEDANDDFSIDGDYHLKSQAGRWDANIQSWVKDNVTSPCIDAGDLSSDCQAELWPHGYRINMGAYGGTPQASMSLSDAGNITDLNFDGGVGYFDVKLLTEKWLFEVLLLPGDISRDGIVNFSDIAFLANDWGLPCLASNPYPPDGGATGTSTNLSWTAGCNAASHDIYFGTSNPPPFVRNQTETTFYTGTMVNHTTYYWRIDEVSDAGKTKGLVWSFYTSSIEPPPPPFPP